MDEREHDEHDEAPVDVPARAARLLADDAVWSEPPPWLGESVAAAIAAERHDAGAPAVPAAPARVGRRRVHRRWWPAAAAAVIAAVAVGALVLSPDRDEDDEAEMAIAGTELAPGALASATVDELAAGVAIRLDVSGLDPAPPGAYYQGWLRSETGEHVSVGTFHQRGGDGRVTLWSGVSIDDFPTLTVSLQREGEGTASSGQVVLRGSLRP